MPIENPSYDSVNIAIEQTALSRKLSSLESKRQATDNWAINNGVKSGLNPREINIISSEYDNGPKASQLRRARDLDIDPSNGQVLEDYSANIRSDMAESIDERITDEPTPEIYPAFTGIRKAIAELRLKRSEEKLERLTRAKTVAAHAGTIILRNKFGEGYYTHTTGGGILQAPDPKRDGKKIEKIERLERHKHEKISKISKLDGLTTDSHNKRRTKSREQKRAYLASEVARLEREIHTESYETPKETKKIEKTAKKVGKLRAKREALTVAHSRR